MARRRILHKKQPPIVPGRAERTDASTCNAAHSDFGNCKTIINISLKLDISSSHGRPLGGLPTTTALQSQDGIDSTEQRLNARQDG